MKLHPAWFSQRVYECIELLFMRLNEDLKLISYENQKYQILDPDLVGLDKFWYIYFYSPEQKVAKKCKEFLWRLASYENSEDIKRKVYEKYIDKILRIMQDSKAEEIEEIHIRGFEIIEKMMT